MLFLCPVSALRAGEVYKSVDAEGHVVYSDRADSSTAPQTVVQIESAQGPPRVFHFCWINCATLTLENGVYARTDGTDESWNIERFTPTSVVLRRHDAPAAWNGFSTDVTYQGQVSNERLINVTVNGKAVPDIQVAWGAALDTLPGNNAERDQRKLVQNYMGSPPIDNEPGVLVEMRAAQAPPPLLNDEQPPCPEEGYLWTPGYWAWGGGYYWVHGAWVRPPRMTVLWTPGYWGYAGGVYAFHPGYWGQHVGFYGGVNYGFGYSGAGFAGGRWVGDSFAYNRTVNNVDTSVIHRTYSEVVVNNVPLSRVSYNGGPGGTMTAATMQERAAAAEPHIPPTGLQRQIAQQAAMNPAVLARANEAYPVVARVAVHTAPRAVAANSAVAPPARATAAPSAVDQPNRVHNPPPATSPPPTTHAQGSSAQPATSKPAGTTATKPQHNPKG